nr:MULTISPECIES: hypothetical protein [unclassified Haladaptatus]
MNVGQLNTFPTTVRPVTELTLADFRTVFGLVLLLMVFEWLMTGDGELQTLATSIGGTIVFLAAFFIVGLLFLYLQRQDAW